MKALVLFFTLLVISQALLAQHRMSSAQISYLYNQEHDFLIQHKVACKDNQFKVFLQFILNSGDVKISDFQLSYDLRASYIDEKQTNSTVPIDSSNVIDIGFRQYVYAFTFEKEENEKLLVVDLFNKAKDIHFSFDISLATRNRPSPYLLFEADKDIPYFARYLNKDHSIRIVNVFGDSSTYRITGIENNKAVAMPPFSKVEVEEAPPEIPLDTLHSNEAEILNFHNEGYYTVETTDYPDTGLPVLVTDAYFPYFNSYRTLTSPLIYVSTPDEYKALQTSENTRDEFETYVRNAISSNSQVARDFIKHYYRRIRKSARLFSEDKEGWKTDRGMIYQVFGNPSEAFRNEKTELWVYPSPTKGKIRFIFHIEAEGGSVKSKLVRNKRHKKAWMQAVMQWRSGRTTD